MKRDADLMRALLLAVEASPHGYIHGNPAVPGYDDETVAYHAFLMDEAGLVEARITKTLSSPSPTAVIVRLTSAGHDFLDVARDDARWKRAVKAAAGVFSIPILKDLLEKLLRGELGLPDG